ncbi:MAG: VWA domain-containing protein [Spirochaetaceae bacterium]|jgi:Ca-activated chloride channel family protein|nr:VWA domain-containing protein [Spirochaetaceae bacterium]
MPNIAFERPFFVLIAALTPFILAALRRFFRGAFSLFVSLGPPGGDSFRPPLSACFVEKLCKTVSISGVLVLLLAVSGPIVVSPTIVWFDRGADILFVLDCSPSMAGMDIAGKRRFDAAVELIQKFSANRPADAIGLVAVGNDAALMIPPTTDRTVLIKKLDGLRIGEMGDGTALGMGISVAAVHLAGSSAPRKAIVLITDGENNAGAIHPETAAKVVAESALSLYVIAVGTTGDIPIDYVDPVTNVRKTGSFESRFNADVLARIAACGGGVFIPAPSEDALVEAFSRVSEAEMTISRSGIREKRSPIHNTFIIAGTLLVTTGMLIKKLALGAFL